MNEMRCVNMHRPVLLFSLGSSQPADPQITAEEKTFWMRTHCGFPIRTAWGTQSVSACSPASFGSPVTEPPGSTMEQPVLSGTSSDTHGHVHGVDKSVKLIWLFVPLNGCLPFPALWREL